MPGKEGVSGVWQEWSWMVTFLLGTMKGKVIEFNRNAMCSAGTLK